jgi:hypothetical protein
VSTNVVEERCVLPWWKVHVGWDENLEKRQGSNQCNFGDVREIIYIGFSLTKEKE